MQGDGGDVETWAVRTPRPQSLDICIRIIIWNRKFIIFIAKFIIFIAKSIILNAKSIILNAKFIDLNAKSIDLNAPRLDWKDMARLTVCLGL